MVMLESRASFLWSLVILFADIKWLTVSVLYDINIRKSCDEEWKG